MGGGGGGEGRESVSNHSEIGVHTHSTVDHSTLAK